MASHIYPIPEVHRTVTRPITMDIIREVLAITGIDPKEFRTKMLGYADAESVPGSTIEPGKEPPNRLATDEKITMEITEEDIGNNITPVRYPDNTPVFHDKDLKITLTPVMSLTKTTVSVVINVPSRVRATNWLAEVKRRIYQTQMTNYHTVDYHYPIPKPFTYYLLKMHEMREAVEGLNEGFGEWMKRCFVNRWTVVSNLKGHESLLAVQERQTNIYGWFNFDFEPEKPEKNAENPSGWEIRFEYTFHYQRPDSMVFAYPLMIHNQLLPIEMIDTERKDDITTYNTYQGATADAYDKIVFQNNKEAMTVPPGVVEPYFDDWYPPTYPLYYFDLARTLISVDKDNPRWAVSLDDVSGYFDFKPEILAFMKKVTNKLVIPYSSIFNIRLFRWDSTIAYPNVSVTSDLKLMTDFDMKLTDMWHVAVYVLGNPLKLNPDGWEDIIDDCKVFHEWFESLFGDKYKDKIKCICDENGHCTVDRDDLDKVLDDMKNETGDGSIGGPGGIPGLPPSNEKFLAGFTIIAKKGK